MTSPQTTEAGTPASTPPVELLDLGPVVVVCYHCTGPHPVERCPARVVCSVCTGNHLPEAHLA